VGLLFHIRFFLTQQKVTTQAEVIEIEIHLEDTPGRVEMSTGLTQVKLQLTNLTMQLQDMAKTKVMCEHVWCTTCRSEGNHRD
jgi:hypothetical protein